MLFVPAVDGDSFKPKDYASSRLVRYYVPADEPNRLRRAAYAVTADTFAGNP